MNHTFSLCKCKMTLVSLWLSVTLVLVSLPLHVAQSKLSVGLKYNSVVNIGRGRLLFACSIGLSQLCSIFDQLYAILLCSNFDQ